MTETLSETDIAVLVALATVCRFSLSAHYPAEFVQKKFPKYLRGEVPRALKNLRKAGLCQQHPTGRNMTWQLTREGLALSLSKIAGVGRESPDLREETGVKAGKALSGPPI